MALTRFTGRVARMLPPLLTERREFRRYWSGQAISLFGDQITRLALPLVAVLVLHARAAQMGYLTAVGLVPNLLFALHAGAWVDRHGHRRRVMIAADLGRAGLLATIPLAYALGVLTLAQLYAVAFLTGTLSMLFVVSQETLFVSVTPPGRYVEANSLLYGSRALSFVGGPSMAGLLVQLLTAPVALLADAVSFLGSALFLGRIRRSEPPVETERHGNVSAGARWIRGSPIMLAALTSGATINFFNFMFSALFVLYATRTLEVPPGTLGAVLGAGAVGSVLGSVVTARITRRIGVGRAYCLGCVLFPAPLVLVPLAGGSRPLMLGLLFAAQFGAGFGVMVLDISIGSIFAAVIPDRLRSRVTGAFQSVDYGVRPLGALVGGALGGWIGLRPTLWIATVGAIAGVLWLLPSPMPRLRTLPERPRESPSAEPVPSAGTT
jgi:MFS family permease